MIDVYCFKRNYVLLFTVVGNYIRIMKKTLNFNFDLYQAFKQQGYAQTWKQREALN